tara:strand:+ start:108 stop:335 length:228 start_codon:yes stop_codon:yes gene_type:complete
MDINNSHTNNINFLLTVIVKSFFFYFIGVTTAKNLPKEEHMHNTAISLGIHIYAFFLSTIRLSLLSNLIKKNNAS